MHGIDPMFTYVARSASDTPPKKFYRVTRIQDAIDVAKLNGQGVMGVLGVQRVVAR